MTGRSSSEFFDLAVIGAGPAGGTLAILSALAGFRTLLVDARRDGDRTRPDGRNFAVVRGSWALLKTAGLTDDLAGAAVPLNGLEATDGGRHWLGRPSALFTAGDLEPAADGTPLGYMVEARRLQAAIDAALAGTSGLSWLPGTRFGGASAVDGGMAIMLGDGSEVRARLVAGCDGVASPVRRAAGIATEGRDYGKSVFAADVTLSRPHHGIARQLFTPEGPFATLPLSGDRANLAWYMKRGAAEMLAARPNAEIEAELNARFRDFAGEMRVEGKATAYPLVLQIANAMIAPGIALVGDAARRINPLAGQGLNLGFKDVAALVEVIEDARGLGLGIGSMTVLERYQAWRRFDANATALALDSVDRIFSNDSSLLKPMRGLALAAASRVSPLRRALARQASADQAALPRRMRTSPLSG